MLTTTETTGRCLVLLDKDNIDNSIKLIRQNVELSDSCQIASTATTQAGALEEAQARQADIIILDKLGIALVNQELDRQKTHSLIATSQDSSTPILAVKPEQIFQAEEPIIAMPPSSLGSSCEDYLKGYRDGVVTLVDQLLSQQIPSAEATFEAPKYLSQSSLVAASISFDESEATWGLQVTGVVNSQYSGRGIKVAIIDSGLDFNHPDFVGRSIVSKSFIPGVANAQDGSGSGTYNTGIVCGPLRPEILPRYGIAYESDIYIAKVLGDNGSGSTFSIVEGIEWAISQGCSVIDLPLGSPVRRGQNFMPFYEAIASRALQEGVLIISAVGNDSQRPLRINPVNSPANCPSIMAVGAIDPQLTIARFSNAGINPDGGKVDLVAPGVDVYSTHPMPNKYTRQSGTARTASFVAGIAALYAEAYPEARGEALWSLLTRNARRLNLPSRDVGLGLVQAP
ncbi:MAG: S8 family serine peptidase [Pleurocapsa sp. MO_226.B13]|nr:S8 family serine peptidase [Pleurocapsa sp. MO_226.B13]